ncbi:MAG TPA: winged helix-turn-helix transcriptional regulator [Candidatus Thermoplasmatota archaeon]
MRLLRDKSLSSRVLILLELRRRPRGTLQPLARSVGLTAQAVSGYVKKLESEGLVERREGLWNLTAAGEEFLEEQVGDLKRFADAAVRDLVRVESCTAIAGKRIARGTRVGLFMEGGRLVAHPGRPSPSQGVAAGAAEAGQDVLVEGLTGIVRIPKASLVALEAPPSADGGSRAVDAAALRRLTRRFAAARWGALDEVGEGVLRTTGVEWHHEVAPLESARASVERGVTAVLVGGPDAVARLIAAVEAARAEGRLPSFAYEVLRLQRAGAPRA